MRRARRGKHRSGWHLRANEVITSISMMFKKNGNKRVPVDTNEVVNDVLNLSRGELRSRKIPFKTVLAPDLPRVPADPIHSGSAAQFD